MIFQKYFHFSVFAKTQRVHEQTLSSNPKNIYLLKIEYQTFICRKFEFSFLSFHLSLMFFFLGFHRFFPQLSDFFSKILWRLLDFYF
jgi:hypothetical protein